MKVKIIKESLKPRDSSEKLITLLVTDPDNQIEDMLNYIKSNSDGGHSFPVDVDSHDSEKSKNFCIDGDGSCRIIGIEVVHGDDVLEEL